MRANKQTERDLRNGIKQSESIMWFASFVYPGKGVNGAKKPMFLHSPSMFPKGILFTRERKAPG